jgi:tRNA A-37 threonylcarbamoyl transferase component Bud32
MPVAPGERMAEVLSRVKDDAATLVQIFAGVGKALAAFHRNYPGCQHGDLQSSNIFISLLKSQVEVTFIDLGGMGLKTLGKSDLEYFRESIQLLARTYGPDFERIASSAFFHSYC